MYKPPRKSKSPDCKFLTIKNTKARERSDQACVLNREEIAIWTLKLIVAYILRTPQIGITPTLIAIFIRTCDKYLDCDRTCAQRVNFSYFVYYIISHSRNKTCSSGPNMCVCHFVLFIAHKHISYYIFSI